MITLDVHYDQPFIQFYQTHPALYTESLQTRVVTIADYFLNQPYQFEPLGEGEQGRYSTLPLYRGDQFDCVTFVDTVLAMAHSSDFTQFQQSFLKIRYLNQKIDYTQRSDWFTDLEWNPHLQNLGYIKDITATFVDENNQPVTKIATAIINKPAYYTQKTTANLNLPQLSEDELAKRLTELKAEGKKFKAVSSSLSYIPFSALFDVQGQPIATLWKQFPDMAVVEIVRPNWRPVNPKDKQTDYGTNLNVSHLGIAIRTPESIIFYHASSNNTVVKLRLIDYLQSFLNDTRPAPIAGIHIEKIR